MATQEDRSLSSGMSFPRWMKNKMNDKLDFEQSAFSPTELDDSFMIYYRNNKSRNSDLLKNNTNSIESGSNTIITSQSTNNNSSNNKVDFSKHTLYCQKFLNNTNDSSSQDPKLAQLTKQPKPNGVDDGFKGEAAKCGSSVIRVAHQMVSGKVIRGFKIQQNECSNNSSGDDMPATTPEGFNPKIRRGSRSLPASPLASPNSSPKAARRVNKYFTGPFVDAENHQGSWILSNLLGKRQKTLSQSVGYIAEEGSEGMKSATSTASIDDLEENKKINKKQVFVAKPSELREMNFWSPTSM